jgi:hypothetical protein
MPTRAIALSINTDNPFGVEITIGNTEPTMATSFATVVDDEAWISAHKERVCHYALVSQARLAAIPHSARALHRNSA